MEEVTSKGDWSPADQKKLLNIILSLGGNSTKRSYKAVEASLKWEVVKVNGKPAEECKAMYQQLISKVRKYRTMEEVVNDAFSLITDVNVKTVVNELPDLPKKPLTAFSLFVKKRSKQFPDMNGANRMKVFANDWNELSEEKKEVYKNKYMMQKKKYEEALDIFRQNHPEYQFSSGVQTSRPQPPLPSKLFIESKLEKIKSTQPELNHAEAVKRLMDTYKMLPDIKKLKWIQKARDCAHTYQDQCEQYLAHHPKSNAKLGVFHLSKEEQRIWHSSKGKPESVPPKNIFMYFCDTRRDALLHLTISEQSKELSAIYHTLTERELKDLEEKFKQEVEEYINSYTQYYLSLSEEEKMDEKSPEEALFLYYKILQKDQRSRKKKKQVKDTLAEDSQMNETKFSDLFPQFDVDADVPHDDSSDLPLSHEDDEVTSMKRKSMLHEDSVITHKKKKSEHEASPSYPKRKNHIDTMSPSTSTYAHNGADAEALLSTWPPLKTEVSEENMYMTLREIGAGDEKKQGVETQYQVTGSSENHFLDMAVDVDDIKQEVDYETEGHTEMESFLDEESDQEQAHEMFHENFSTEDVDIKVIKVESVDGEMSSADTEMSEMENLEQPDFYEEQEENIPAEISEHGENTETVSKEKTQPVASDTYSEIYECHYCGVEFNNTEQLEEHKIIHAQELANVCDICGAGFTQSNSLKRHKRIHTGEKPYKCDVCNVGFSSNESLVIHIRIHTGEKPFTCDVCDAGFSTSWYLKVHKRIHTGEKPYKCDVCGGEFSSSGYLKVHKRIHTGEKPYKCDICGTGCATSSDLTVHKRVHTGERPYKCDVCGVSFSSNGYLKVHTRIHTGERPYKCDVCGIGFSCSGQLKAHNKIHTGERPYKCDICGVGSSTIASLNFHKKIHTRERSYKCDICGTAYSCSGNLKKHQKMHTG